VSKRTIGADGLDELPEHRPGWFAVTVKDSNGLQAGYAYAQPGERFKVGEDGRLIPVVMIPVDKPPTQSTE
jgi:hypothetical protein